MARIGSLSFSPELADIGQNNPLRVPSVLLFVGPNESGKSLTLRSIKEWYEGSRNDLNIGVLKGGEFETFDKNRLREFLGPLITYAGIDGNEEFFLLKGTEQGAINESPRTDLNSFSAPDSFKHSSWRNAVLQGLRIFPTYESVRSILDESDARPFYADESLENIHQLLLSDRSRLDKVNRLVKPASNFYLAVQPTKAGTFRFQLNPEEPPEEIPSLLLSKKMKNYFENELKIGALGDGIRTFIGLVLSVFAFEHKLIFLDEPEIHLHPPLAKRLAQELVLETLRRNGQLIVATHSPDFLAGCIGSTDDIAVIRMTYSRPSSRSTVRIMSKPDLSPFVIDRVVRNTDAINGIFHETSIIVEGVFDKIAYSEFNHCLEKENKGRAIRDPHFVAAGSCAQVLNVTKALRKTGTPTAAILDFDVLHSNDLEWEQLMSEKPKDENIHSLKRLAAIVKNNLQSELIDLDMGQKKQRLKNEGIDILAGEALQQAKELLDLLAKEGIFIVANGEAENLVATTLGFNKSNCSKEKTIVDIGLKKLGALEYSIPEDLSNPTESLWSLLNCIREWSDRQVR